MHVHAFNVLKTGFFTHHLGQNEKCLSPAVHTAVRYGSHESEQTGVT